MFIKFSNLSAIRIVLSRQNKYKPSQCCLIWLLWKAPLCYRPPVNLAGDLTHSAIQPGALLPLVWVLGTIPYDHQGSTPLTNYCPVAFMVKRMYLDGNNGKGWKLNINLRVNAFQVSMENSSELRTRRTLVARHEKTGNWMLARLLTARQSFLPGLREAGGANSFLFAPSRVFLIVATKKH